MLSCLVFSAAILFGITVVNDLFDTQRQERNSRRSKYYRY